MDSIQIFKVKYRMANNAVQNIANVEAIERNLRVVASPGNAAAVGLPMYPEGANYLTRQGINASRLEHEDALGSFLDMFSAQNDTGKETLLFIVALDDILTHMRSIQYDQSAIEQVENLLTIVRSLLDSSERVPEETADEINNLIAFYHTNVSGSLYGMLRQMYIDDKLRRRQNFRSMVPGLQARYRGRLTRRLHPAEVQSIEVGRKRRAEEANASLRAQEALEKAAKANANLRAQEALEKAAKANASRRAQEAREARLKRFGGPSQRRTRRRRSNRRSTRRN